jgi:hypothetical protein
VPEFPVTSNLPQMMKEKHGSFRVCDCHKQTIFLGQYGGKLPEQIAMERKQSPRLYMHRIFVGNDYEKRIEQRTVRKV